MQNISSLATMAAPVGKGLRLFLAVYFFFSFIYCIRFYGAQMYFFLLEAKITDLSSKMKHSKGL